MAVLDFELNRIWPDGIIGFDDSPDVVVVRGDFDLKVDSQSLPGARDPKGAVMNDWLRHFHELMYRRSSDVLFDISGLAEEQVVLTIKKSEFGVRVVNRRRRPVPGFEGFPVDRKQVEEMAARFELRLKELLLALTEPRTQPFGGRPTPMVPSTMRAHG